VLTPTNSDFSVITIEGDLKLGDEKKFIEKVLKVQDGVVVLGSDGGNLRAGIEIGKAIRLKGLQTFVPDGALCASACAIAWLAGAPRLMSPTAKVGFHAAYKLENGESQVSGPGNALAGAYLNMLGLPDRAITYITSAAPRDMTWLSFKDAEEVGIDVKQFDLPSETTAERNQPAAPKTAAVEAPAVPQSRPQGQEAVKTEPELLDLTNPTEVSRVQRRLQERGFFAGVIDGAWDGKSRIALVDFKILNGLGHDDGWDLRVQRALFDDRSRAAPTSYNPFGSG
jgi:hypothetical protein